LDYKLIIWLIQALVFVAENRPKNRPPCPVKKSDSAIHSLSVPGVVIAVWLRLQ